MINILVGALVFSFWCVTLFFEKRIGLSMLLFILPLTYYIIYILQQNNKIENSKAKILLIPITLLSSTYFIFNNAFFNTMNSFIIPILIIILISALFNEKFKLNLSLITNIIELIFIPLSCIGETFEKLKDYLTNKFKLNIKLEKQQTTRKVIKSIFITIPVVLIIILLLSSADEIFGSIFSSVFENVVNSIIKINISSLITRIILVISLFAYLISFFYYITVNYEIEETIENKKKIVDNFTIKMILTALNIIYLVFCYIQIKSLFMKNVDINYAEYARQGFFQLMIVSIINLITILIAKQSDEDTQKSTYTNVMSLIMIAFTFIILISSAVRMYFYESAYGYTLLRLLVYCILLTETLLLIPTTLYILNKKINLVKTYFSIIITIYVCMNFANFDNIIAKRNIDRYIETGKIDMYYLRTETGTDAVSQIIRIVEIDKEINNTQIDALKYLKSIYEDLEQQSFDIREYNISKNMAKSLIEKRL